MSTRGAVRAAQRAYDEHGIRGDYVTTLKDRFVVVGRGRDGHTAIFDVPRTTARVTVARAHDVDHWPNENARLDAMFAAYRNR